MAGHCLHFSVNMLISLDLQILFYCCSKRSSRIIKFYIVCAPSLAKILCIFTQDHTSWLSKEKSRGILFICFGVIHKPFTHITNKIDSLAKFNRIYICSPSSLVTSWRGMLKVGLFSCIRIKYGNECLQQPPINIQKPNVLRP